MKWVKIYQIWYIEGDFWGVFVYILRMLCGCGAILMLNIGVLSKANIAINGQLCVVNSPKLCENTRNSGKMAHYGVFSLYFVQILGWGAILCVIPYVCSLYNIYK